MAQIEIKHVENIKMALLEIPGVEECRDFMNARFELTKKRLRSKTYAKHLEARLCSPATFSIEVL